MDSHIRWCRYLNNPENKYSLLKTTKINEGNVVVCQQLKYRQFARFENHSDFLKYQRCVQPFENCFYEIMTENMRRKPYFDIDIKRYPSHNLLDKTKSDELIKKLKENIVLVLAEKIGEEKANKAQILVYTSHTEKKLSYHVIIHGYYLKDHRECKNFFEHVSEKTEWNYQSYIDCSVYKTVQQLRMLGSHKYFVQNNKTFSPSLSDNYIVPERYLRFPKGKESYMLLTSLVTNMTDCDHLPGFEYVEPNIDYGRFIYLPESDAERLDFLEKIINDTPNKPECDGLVKVALPGKAGAAEDKDLDEILDVFYAKYPKEAFKFKRIISHDGNLIITFLRRRSTFCDTCQRKHYNENPYVRVNGMNRDLYFHCRRESEDKGELFGSLGKLTLKDIDVQDIINSGAAPAKDILLKEETEAGLRKLEEDLTGDAPDKVKGDLSTELGFLKL